jgi:hypothetical protein
MSEDTPLHVAALAWGVKESFRRYVEAAGAIEIFGSAERAGDGCFVFPATANSDLRIGADGILRGQAAFSGEVLFKAHGGALNVRLTDPVLESARKLSCSWSLKVVGAAAAPSSPGSIRRRR